jgi:hypothetical protein
MRPCQHLLPLKKTDPPLPDPWTAFLKVKFHKVLSKPFEIQRVRK